MSTALAVTDPLSLLYRLLFALPAATAISFMVYLAPVPTFYGICKKRTTEDFQAVPYVIAQLSAMLMFYYALVKTHSPLLLAINGIGCFIETVYIVLFLVFAPRKVRISTLKLLLLLNVVAYGIIVCSTLVLLKGSARVQLMGWINVGFSVSVFAAPLGVMRHVIRTRSAESIPFCLSCFLTVSAVAWFAYGFLIRDFYVAAPNVLGFLFGAAQIALYIFYRDAPRPREGHKVDPEKATADVVSQDGKLQAVKPDSMAAPGWGAEVEATIHV
ncbi:hypothetical protein Taro_054554 [Colocasia esculenta]|uniref:Bidirectional sugar transporter SWEET n=1 Tax=Colocasia esculenta TaxID=4460 RepID=A0A843XQX8_COLES|nr:hypothetical protein [Colocasia esculenta]